MTVGKRAALHSRQRKASTADCWLVLEGVSGKKAVNSDTMTVKN